MCAGASTAHAALNSLYNIASPESRSGRPFCKSTVFWNFPKSELKEVFLPFDVLLQHVVTVLQTSALTRWTYTASDVLPHIVFHTFKFDLVCS